MSILEQIDESTIDAQVEANGRDDVLRRIAALAKTNKILKKFREEDVYQALEARERLGTTGFGDGIAIPHCSFPGIDDFVVGFCRIRAGVDFASLDGKPVFVVFFIIGPEDQRNRHIQILSTISKILAEPKNVKDFRRAGTPPEVLGIIRSESGPDVEVQQSRERCLFHIIVQREEFFDQVMQILSAEVQGEIAVIEAHNAGSYLNRMPLFSAYWGEDSGRFTRIIVAVADRGVCNDIIRRIYLISDDIERKGGILITAQDLVFAGGSLDF
jgi:mannitol/fructose-specific phosphotransferase system IIA component (Ntr-type)